jgi:hypothetical protein
MGLGQGAYLGRKLIVTDAPQIGSVTPQPIKPGQEVTIAGQNLGTASSGGMITVNGKLLTTPITWSDTLVKFVFPKTRLDSAAGSEYWQSGEVATISLSVHGKEVSIPVSLPHFSLNEIPRTPWQKGGILPLKLTGIGFGAWQDGSCVLVDKNVASVIQTDWKDAEVQFMVPPTTTLDDADVWKDIPIRILAHGFVASNIQTLRLTAKPEIVAVDLSNLPQIKLEGRHLVREHRAR